MKFFLGIEFFALPDGQIAAGPPSKGEALAAAAGSRRRGRAPH